MNTCQCCGKLVISGVTVWTGTELVYRHYLCQDQLPRLTTVPERAPAGMLAVRVGSDPWTMVPLDS